MLRTWVQSMASEGVALGFNVPVSFKDSPTLLCKLLRHSHALFVLFIMVSYLHFLCNIQKGRVWKALGKLLGKN